MVQRYLRLGGRAFGAKDFTTSQILHAWSRGGQRFGLVGSDHPVIIQARHTSAAPSGLLVRCHQQNFYMLWLGDNYRDFKRGLPPEQSRDNSARRKVSSPFFLLFLAPHPCPPMPTNTTTHQRIFRHPPTSQFGAGPVVAPL